MVLREGSLLRVGDAKFKPIQITDMHKLYNSNRISKRRKVRENEGEKYGTQNLVLELEKPKASKKSLRLLQHEKDQEQDRLVKMETNPNPDLDLNPYLNPNPNWSLGKLFSPFYKFIGERCRNLDYMRQSEATFYLIFVLSAALSLAVGVLLSLHTYLGTVI
jgi:predicted nucleic acid-binding Zn ribbon protein